MDEKGMLSLNSGSEIKRGNIPEIITFGESMALLTPKGNKGLEYSGDLDKSFGGAESNLAIGVARLGHQAGWFGRLGNDPYGRYITKVIRGEGVDVSRSILSDDAGTGLMSREEVAGKVSVYYHRKHSAASYMQPEHLDEEYISKARILHITGITPALSDNCTRTVKEAVRLARKHGVKISFDPNLRLKLWNIEEARPVLLELAEQADYFLPGLDELKLLYATEDVDVILDKLKNLGAVSIIKGGNEETMILENGSLSSVPYFKVDKVIDPIGAGDGFCAGFMVGLLKGYSHKGAVKLGNLIGSMVVQLEGDWEALPTWAQVDTILGNKTHVER
jgi:2-dehydro-3-deoxygluconokinase